MAPRIFISSVSYELASARQLVANALTRLGYEPVWQDIFGTESGDLRQMLRDKIDGCHGLIHLVGFGYGAEPSTPEPEFGRVSYTQFEFLYARARGKKTWLIFADEGCTRDHPIAELDLPPESDHPDPAGYQAERRALQETWRKRWLREGHLQHGAATDSDLELRVERLKDEFSLLRRAFQEWQRNVTVILVGIAALVLLSIGIGWYFAAQQRDAVEKIPEEVVEQTTKKVEQAIEQSMERAVQALIQPAILADRIRQEIAAAAEKKIMALPDKGSGKLIAQIETERDLALGRVDDLIKLIQAELKDGASPIFQRAIDIFQKEGTEETLVYLDSRRPATLDTARRHAEQAKSAQARATAEKEQRNKALQALVLEAELRETRLEWEDALRAREQIAEIAPDWFAARNLLGKLLYTLGRYGAAEPHWRAAVKLADGPSEESGALNNLASLLQDTNRTAEAEPLMRRALALSDQGEGAEDRAFARNLNNLANFLQNTNRPAEAEPLLRRALVILERTQGTESPEVAMSVNNLAQLLQTTNRLSEAEPLLRRTLALLEKSPEDQQYRFATGLNNLAHLLQITNRQVEAEPLMRWALVIAEKTLGPQHPQVALNLNNLANLLQNSNRMREAEPLMRRALAINELSLGADHPQVALTLNNLAQLLQDTNRLWEAEPLMRRALAIDVQSRGADHPSVGIKLGNLANLLRATKRFSEAEPLMREALVIFEKSLGPKDPQVSRALNNLAQLLQATGRVPESVPLLRRCCEIQHQFGRDTGFEHPHTRTLVSYYRAALQARKLPADEIEARVKETTTSQEPLKPIVPEVARLLGPAAPVADALAALDKQYKIDGKPAVYFLAPDQPIAPHLADLLRPSPDSLNAAGLDAYRNHADADAVVFFEETLKLVARDQETAQPSFLTRISRAAALRELGDVKQAADELRSLLKDVDENPETPHVTKGRCRYQLALCDWLLGDREQALRGTEEALRIFGEAPPEDPQVVSVRKITEKLLVSLRNNKPPPPLPKGDPSAALAKARVRYQARVALANLGLTEPAVPLLDQLLGPAKPAQQVFESLDRQYREQGKPAIWFLPLSEPISPHLDELLGPPKH